jgi:hypothetical protein
MLEVLSYGAGKQTFAMLILIEKGILPKPDLVIFADTQGEKPQTYWHIDNVAKPLCEKLGIEFVTISKGSLEQYCLDNQYNPMPPTCTMDFKVRPINMYLFNRFAFEKGYPQARIWVGISTDEAHRNTPSTVKYVEKRFPLLEIGYSRDDCIFTIRESGYPEPDKSGCLYCPHNNTKAWRIIRVKEPVRFARAKNIELNARLRNPKARLPNFGPGLVEIDREPVFEQTEMHWDSDDYMDDDNCSTGSCMV